MSLKTTFEGGKASNVIAVQGAPQSKVDPVSADAVVLPNSFLGSYAALGKRLQGRAAGTELRAYIAPQGEVAIKLTAVVPERMETPKGAFAATRYALTLSSPPPTADLSFNLWTNADGNLLRLSIPAQTIEMAREDIASAASRTTAFSIPGDETVQIPAVGFNLAATVTRPPKSTGLLPAVVLIGGSAPTDRDEVVAGIPVFGQIARDLVAAGFMVVRYDKRGLGQSGGRAESVDDRRLRRRRARDPVLARQAKGRRRRSRRAGRPRRRRRRRHARRRPRARPGSRAGADGRHRHDRRPAGDRTAEASAVADADRRCAAGGEAGVAGAINQAVIKGTGWIDIPDSVRRVADTPWFYSFLTFNPAKAMSDVRQPVLIVQGELDTQVPPHHADELAVYARERKNKAAVRGREGARRQSPVRAGQDRRARRVPIARPGCEGVDGRDVGDRLVADEDPRAAARRFD